MEPESSLLCSLVRGLCWRY